MPPVARVSDLIGNTPLVRLDRLAPVGVEVAAKVEFLNPGGSIKDRPVREMLDAAERRGDLREGSVVIEATSGNTGISLAMLCAERGYVCVLVMPEDMSLERRRILRAYGARVELTPKEAGMAGALQRARDLAAATGPGGAFTTRQFENPDNPAAHMRTTAEEILRDCDGRLDVLVAGVGTGGTLTGTARALRVHLPNLRVVAVEPQKAQAFQGLPFHPHAIQGIGAGFVPPVVDRALIDAVVAVTDDEALQMAARVAQRQGLLVGPSSGANVAVALQEAARLPAGGRVVTFLCDSGERYLS
ncbi:MAG: cysteine synthase A [Myxococcales bacterium]|nr:cysteine synthase A [Myxococcales bacterium]